LAASLFTRFPDAAVAALVGADGVHEWPVAVAALGEGPPAVEPTRSAASGAVDAEPLEFPLATAAQRAGECDALGAPWERADAVDVHEARTERLDAVVYARSSQRRMDPSHGLPESLLRTSLRVALRGITLPHRIVVHDVDGLAPGLYRWPNLSAPVRSGAMRDELYRVTTSQALARDAAFVVVATADVGELDDREYREAQLGAGLVEGRLHLVAYALGASASGMTFADDDIRGLLDEPLDALLFTCVGVPEYKPALGGPPGAPTAIRMVRSSA
jgi:hypothetical protein